LAALIRRSTVTRPFETVAPPLADAVGKNCEF